MFLREIVRFLEQQGLFGADFASAPASLPAAIRIPEGVREVIGRRLNLLSAACNEALALAAVIGREFSDELLLRAVGHDDQKLTDVLDEALEAHIIEERPDGHYQFAHNLIRMTLYDELRPARRRQMHRAVGAALEASRRSDLDAALPELARHFIAAGESRPCTGLSRTRAGQRAEALLAFEDAVLLFQSALDTLDQRGDRDETERCRLLLLLGDAQRKTNAFPQALATLLDAAEHANRLDDVEMCARAALVYEHVAWRYAQQVDKPARQLLDRALALDDMRPALRAQLTGALARALLHEGAEREAKREGERAIAMARQLRDPSVLATCLYCMLAVINADSSEDLLRLGTEDWRPPTRLATWNWSTTCKLGDTWHSWSAATSRSRRPSWTPTYGSMRVCGSEPMRWRCSSIALCSH